MPLKICQLCTVDFTLYHFLRPLMKALRDEGHEVVGVCADGELVDAVRQDGFRVETAPLVRSINPLRNLQAAGELHRLFRRESFDMVHTHTPVGAFVGRLAARCARVPRIIYTAHGFYFRQHACAAPGGAYRAGVARRPGDPHAVYPVTGRCRDRAAAGALPNRRHRAIGNGSDPEIFRPDVNQQDRQRIRAAIGTPDERVVILMTGRLVAEKGYRELIEAMRRVDAELWAVGARLRSDHATGIEDVVSAAEDDPCCATASGFWAIARTCPTSCAQRIFSRSHRIAKVCPAPSLKRC